ncbi:MAG TPA: GDP-mannose 4,6-dehydratase [Vicinamibacteria bacterium]|nr:GDP-mannose 4,6-dehydratase [Vicinamibacteria bacterium]
MLVTGAAGFVGRHLTAYLHEGGHEVLGLVLPKDVGPTEPFETRGVDLLDDDALADAVSTFVPDTIYHLAAFSNPERSFGSARKTLETNVIGANNLLSAAASTGRRPRVLLVGSAQQYGLVDRESQPISEEQVLRPQTPYAVSKVSQELLGQQYVLAEELPVYLTRSFNHTGPGQSDVYVCSSFAKQVAESEKGLREPVLRAGNLEARRDFSDVRDVVRAYEAIIDHGRPGRVYNVCSGEAVAIRDVVDQLVALAHARVRVSIDPELYHTIDAPLIVGSNRRLRSETGWTPRYALAKTLRDLLDDWRRRL